VTAADGRRLFEPGWGRYDMAVGARIASVFGGVADRERYQLHKPLPRTRTHGHSVPPELLAQYEFVAGLGRGGGTPTPGQLQKLEAVLDCYPDEWLLRAELLSWQDSALPESLKARSSAELRERVRDSQERRALGLVLPGLFEA
jgi:phenylalanine-4-hydroxylase